MLVRIWAIIKKEFLHILRDPRYLFLTLFFPIIILLLYGYGVTLEAKNIPVIIQDFDQSALSRQLVDSFSHYEHFRIKYYLNDFSRASRFLKAGQAKVIFTVPEGFSRALAQNRKVSLQIILDGADSNTANIAANYLVALVNAFLANYFQENSKGQFKQLISFEPRVWFNPELDTNIFLIPGLVVIIMLLTTVLLTALAIVSEREQGTMEQLSVSPIKPRELLLGKIIPYGVIGYIDFTAVVLVGHFVFGVPVMGNLFLLFLLAGIFIAGGLSMGLLISTIAGSTVEAMMISILSTMLPSFLLSGFVFPISNMPKIIQLLTYFIPARYFIFTIRGILLKGSGLAVLWPDILFLIIFDLVVFNLAVRRLQKKQVLQSL